VVTSCDTSFLFSLYGEDVHSDKAVAWVREWERPLHLSPLNVFEFGNALRFAAFKGFYPVEAVTVYRADFEAALRARRLLVCRPNLAHIIESASELSERYTLEAGHRSFDILHVAAACVLKSDAFLSFDANQNKLAIKLGLRAPFGGARGDPKA